MPLPARTSELVAQTIAAHGGAQLWEGAGEVRVEVSSGGLAFASKLQGRAVRGVDARVSTRGQHVTLSPYPGPGERGVLREDGSVRIETDAGEMISVRENAREACAHLRHKLWWDRLDILYFATQALWTYVSTPFVFERDGYGVRELEPWSEDGKLFRRLAVTFPPHVHTHSREQVFYIGESGLIRRHDYTAEPISRLAKAAHYCMDHQSFDGLMIATRRRVYPRKADNTRRARPLLVWIEMPSARIHAAEA
jgi:hypothetical protein